MDERINENRWMRQTPDLRENTRKGLFRFTLEDVKAAAVVLYFSAPFLKWVLGFFVSSYANYITMLLPWIPVLLLFGLQKARIKAFDFIVLWLGIIFFFCLTYLFHPDYEYWYTRDYYGVWDNVLRPDNGLYAYLFLRLLDDPKKILKCLKFSAFLCLLYYSYQFYQVIRVGYWITYWNGTLLHTSYNLEFGYNVLLYALVFLYSALKTKKLSDWIMAVLGLLLIVGGGSRGPVLDTFLFLIVYYLAMLNSRRNKLLLAFVLIAIGLGLYFFFTPILDFFSSLFEKIGVTSRFIKLFLAGDVADDNGRLAIWNRAIEMIRANPLGYGAMGSRQGIYEIIHVGHPHNVFLEFLIDYGVLLGTGLIVGGIVSLIRILRMPDIGEWKGLALIFTGCSFQLLLSGTYWHRMWLWALLSVGVSVHYMRKKGFVQNG